MDGCCEIVAEDEDVVVMADSVARASNNDEEAVSGEEGVGDVDDNVAAAAADEDCQPEPDPLDQALEAVEHLDVRVKEEPLESVGDLLMDDELRLQLEESIDMVVNELSTPENEEEAAAASVSFANDGETLTENECGDGGGGGGGGEMTSSTSAPDSVIDSMNDLEGTLDPDLQAVCDVLRMANASPTLRRRSDDEAAVSADVRVNVKREPRDATLAHLLNAVESTLPRSSSASATVATVSSSSSNGVDDKRRDSNPIDLLTMLSLDKKPSALSILPVRTEKNATESSMLPSVTIKSLSSAGGAAGSTRIFDRNAYTSMNDEYNTKPAARKPPNLLPVDSKIFGRGPDSFSCAMSLPSSSTGNSGGGAGGGSSSSLTSLTKITNSASIPPSCCSTLPSRAADAAHPYNTLYSRTSSSARPASCSYSSFAYRRMSPYPPGPPQYQPHHMSSYAGAMRPAAIARGVGPYSAATVPRPYSSNPPPPPPPLPSSSSSTYGVNGSCCTSVAAPVSPSMMMMNSKPSTYSTLPPALPQNTCRMPLSPISPSYARTRDYSNNMFPDSTANIANLQSDAMAVCMPQSHQQNFRPRSGWSGGSLNPLHHNSAATSSSSCLQSPKGGRGSSMPMVVQHSNPAPLQPPPPPYKNQLPSNGGSGGGPSTSFNYPVSSVQNGNVGLGSVANPYEDFSPSSGMPFQRAQCCFSSQIQCFNSACDNAAAQQHVSIIQHSTRLSNLKSTSMDSISSLLQYHSYFKKY